MRTNTLFLVTLILAVLTASCRLEPPAPPRWEVAGATRAVAAKRGADLSVVLFVPGHSPQEFSPEIVVVDDETDEVLLRTNAWHAEVPLMIGQNARLKYRVERRDDPSDSREGAAAAALVDEARTFASDPAYDGVWLLSFALDKTLDINGVRHELLRDAQHLGDGRYTKGRVGVALIPGPGPDPRETLRAVPHPDGSITFTPVILPARFVLSVETVRIGTPKIKHVGDRDSRFVELAWNEALSVLRTVELARISDGKADASRSQTLRSGDPVPPELETHADVIASEFKEWLRAKQ